MLTPVNWEGWCTENHRTLRSDAPSDLVFQSLKTTGPMWDHNILVRHIKPVAKEAGARAIELVRHYAAVTLPSR
jgi:hypothetical protein